MANSNHGQINTYPSIHDRETIQIYVRHNLAFAYPSLILKKILKFLNTFHFMNHEHLREMNVKHVARSKIFNIFRSN